MTKTLEAYFSSEDYVAPNGNYNFLPICHTTTENVLSDIINSKNLSPSPKPCKIYDYQELLYFFYGKSAYVVDPGNFINLNRRKPVVLLYKFEHVRNQDMFVRLLPFDSGGFSRYKFSRGTKKNTFTISASPEKVKDLVHLIYGNNGGYINEQIDLKSLSLASKHSKAVSHIEELYNRLSDLPVGRQAVTIELQVKEQIPSPPLAVFIPHVALTGKDFFKTKDEILKAFPGAELITYIEINIPKPEPDKLALTFGHEAEAFLHKEVKSMVQRYV